MKDEIKEIYLSNLKWTKTHDNIGGVMGNVIFKDDISYEECGKLVKSGYFILCDKDYITNLQKENKQLKQRNKEIYDGFMVAIDEVCETNREKREYKSRIDKAIECINYYAIEDDDFNKLYDVEEQELLTILGDKEND